MKPSSSKNNTMKSILDFAGIWKDYADLDEVFAELEKDKTHK